MYNKGGIVLAVLKNIKNDTNIDLRLKKTNEFPGWIGYDLRVLINKDKKISEFLRLNYPDTLSFDNLIEPEIPFLYGALDALSKNEICNYVFEPIDEKDFCLEIIKKDNLYRVNLFLEEALLFETYHWDIYSKVGLRMKVEKNDLINFSSELKKEYKRILEE